MLIRAGGLILSVGQTVLLARALGPEDLGVYSAIIAIATLVVLPAPSGVSDFLYRQVSRALADGDMPHVRGLRNAATRLGLLYSAAAAVLLGVFALTSVLPRMEGPTTVLTLCLAVTLGLDPLRAGLMRGMGSALMAQVPENIVRPGIFTAGVVVLLLILPDGMTASWALAAFNVAGVAALVFGILVLRRWVPAGPATAVDVRTAFRQSLDQSLFAGTQLILSNIDITLLSLLGFFVAAGQFKVALLGVVALLFVYNALAFVSVRDISIAFAREDRPAVARAADRLTLGGLASTGAITLVILLVGRPVVSFVFGPEFTAAADALSIIAVGHVVATACGASVEMVRLLDSRWFAIASNLVGMVVVVGLSLLLVRWLDPLTAVAVASAAGNVGRRVLLAVQVSQRLQMDTSLMGTLRRRLTRTAG